jgi:hypothetical protein
VRARTLAGARFRPTRTLALRTHVPPDDHQSPAQALAPRAGAGRYGNSARVRHAGRGNHAPAVPTAGQCRPHVRASAPPTRRSSSAQSPAGNGPAARTGLPLAHPQAAAGLTIRPPVPGLGGRARREGGQFHEFPACGPPPRRPARMGSRVSGYAAATGDPNQALNASASPASVPSPTHATWPSGRTSTAAGAVTAPSAGSSHVPPYSASTS